MGKKKYVAYGSNLNVCQMARRCPNATVFGIGKIKDYQLTFRGVATIVPEQGREVPVAVWEIDERDEKSLDIYEGYPSFYRKETIAVEMENGETIDGMVYIMNSGIPHQPSQIYYEVIKQGYQDVGLDTKYLDEALKDTERRK